MSHFIVHRVTRTKNTTPDEMQFFDNCVRFVIPKFTVLWYTVEILKCLIFLNRLMAIWIMYAKFSIVHYLYTCNNSLSRNIDHYSLTNWPYDKWQVVHFSDGNAFTFVHLKLLMLILMNVWSVYLQLLHKLIFFWESLVWVYWFIDWVVWHLVPYQLQNFLELVDVLCLHWNVACSSTAPGHGSAEAEFDQFGGHSSSLHLVAIQFWASFAVCAGSPNWKILHKIFVITKPKIIFNLKNEEV